MAATEALNVNRKKGHSEAVVNEAINFEDVFRRPQVVYFHLPSSLGTTSAAEIARIALYSLLASARNVADKERRKVFVFIDEFQRIIASCRTTSVWS